MLGRCSAGKLHHVCFLALVHCPTLGKAGVLWLISELFFIIPPKAYRTIAFFLFENSPLGPTRLGRGDLMSLFCVKTRRVFILLSYSMQFDCLT